MADESHHAAGAARPALLLLGPTGSGKTPLGRLIESRGLWGQAWWHFDFGENLRQAVARDRPDGILSADDLAFLRDVLATGRLLEDEHFPIARRLLQSFLAQRSTAERPDADQAGAGQGGRAERGRAEPERAEPGVVLNGLPRHVGQAERVEALLDVRAVIALECDATTVLARLARDTGGDRGGRPDDRPEDVRRKLAIFNKRTSPLLGHYAARGVPIIGVRVGSDTSPEAVLQAVAQRG
jgi:adenylate kinase family enzyme